MCKNFTFLRFLLSWLFIGKITGRGSARFVANGHDHLTISCYSVHFQVHNHSQQQHAVFFVAGVTNRCMMQRSDVACDIRHRLSCRFSLHSALHSTVSAAHRESWKKMCLFCFCLCRFERVSSQFSTQPRQRRKKGTAMSPAACACVPRRVSAAETAGATEQTHDWSKIAPLSDEHVLTVGAVPPLPQRSRQRCCTQSQSHGAVSVCPPHWAAVHPNDAHLSSYDFLTMAKGSPQPVTLPMQIRTALMQLHRCSTVSFSPKQLTN